MAQLIEWKSEYQLGNQTIDNEHEQLFNLANQIFTLEKSDDVVEKIKPILYELYDYMDYHFNREEVLMRQIAYTEIEGHQQKHQEIIKALNKILKSSQGYDELTDRLSTVMVKWLLQHILKEDFKLKPLLKSN